MKNSNSNLIIGVVVVIVIVLGVGIWYATQSSTATPSDMASTTATTTGATAAGTKTSGTASTKSTGSVTKTTTTVTTTTGVPATVVPIIIKFEPASATVGSTVTVIGSGFDKTQNTVLFGSTGNLHRADGTPDNQIAVAASADGTTLTFTVPTSGPSGSLCDSNNRCSGVSGSKILPGQYPVTISNKNGVSNTGTFIVVAN